MYLQYLTPLILAAGLAHAGPAPAPPVPARGPVVTPPPSDSLPEPHLLALRQESLPSTTTQPPNPCLTSLALILTAFPTPTSAPDADLPPWAQSSAPILLISSAIASSNFSFESALGGAENIEALCTAAVKAVSPPSDSPELAAAYSSYLDQVQMWRFAVEGDAYRLAEKCGGRIGLGLELLMATEAPMCTSGIKATVKPWATGGSTDVKGVGTNAGERLRMGMVGLLGVVAVVFVFLL
ncbi:hypothetical protein QBC35DRAFT_486596 [Podospora australis]|uniref:Infection structure specific protein n=1 Tax=Podospora australis TaxID=1536484 RepID=A0AAN6X574_9PEZI|nr:hypothetical protein QBC35DRAFT_486596 [Podospora australis]